MAHPNQPPPDDLLQQAVELRMGGFKWEVVAEKVRRAASTVRRWPLRYPERWEAAVERAERRLAVDSNAESVVVLRNMLRADDLKWRWYAAKTLVGMRIELGKLGLRTLATRAAAGITSQPAADSEYQYFRFLQQKSDQELAEFAQALGFPPALGHVGHAGDSSTGEQKSSCDVHPAARG
jgi:hypothetical protein